MTSAFVPRSFVAIGDSFTEGLDDADREGGLPRLGGPGCGESSPASSPAFAYANLAIRGRSSTRSSTSRCRVRSRCRRRPGQPGRRHQRRTAAQGRHGQRWRWPSTPPCGELRESGARVLLFQSVDPTPRSRLIGSTLEPDQGADPHRRADGRALRLLPGAPLGRAGLRPPGGVERRSLAPVARGARAGSPVRCWRPSAGAITRGPSRRLDPVERPGLVRKVAADARWARRHLGPWIGRRLRGVSSGDSIEPKRPDLEPVLAASRLPANCGKSAVLASRYAIVPQFAARVRRGSGRSSMVSASAAVLSSR